ncbi:MAG: hypothetical protein IKO42_04395, partial [Opitutales bacterium]|nr:hypothetical protein [Opitutales bacterium]
HRRAAEAYFADGSVEGACPPLKALLHIMKDGNYGGKTLRDPEIRNMFRRDEILKSDWYAERLIAKQQMDLNSIQKNIAYLNKRLQSANVLDSEAQIKAKIAEAEAMLKSIKTLNSLKSLEGTLGVDPYLF